MKLSLTPTGSRSGRKLKVLADQGLARHGVWLRAGTFAAPSEEPLRRKGERERHPASRSGNGGHRRTIGSDVDGGREWTARAVRLPRDDSGSVCVRAVAVAELGLLVSESDHRDAAGLRDVPPSPGRPFASAHMPLSTSVSAAWHLRRIGHHCGIVAHQGITRLAGGRRRVSVRRPLIRKPAQQSDSA